LSALNEMVLNFCLSYIEAYVHLDRAKYDLKTKAYFLNIVRTGVGICYASTGNNNVPSSL